MASAYDRFVRSLSVALSRRGMAGLLAGGALATAEGETFAKRKKKKRKGCKPACGECQVCRKRVCLPFANGTPCASADVCEGGQCVALGCGDGPACDSASECIAGDCVALRCGAGGPCRVFNSLDLLAGAELGGLAGADQICQIAAERADLRGTYMAWLSAGETSPANRFTNRNKAGPYQLPPNGADGAGPPPTVSPDFATLTSCIGATAQCLQHPINRSADGNIVNVGEFPVWTGTLQNGTAATDSCNGWTGEGLGVIGIGSTTDESWTNTGSDDCLLSSGSLYCFEQA